MCHPAFRKTSENVMDSSPKQTVRSGLLLPSGISKEVRMEHSRSLERRTLIKRASMFAGALFGLGLTSKVSAKSTPTPLSVTVPLTLHGIRWQLTYPDRPRGVIPQPGQRSSVFGELLSTGEGTPGAKVGEFYASSLQFSNPFGYSELSADAM